jgi:GR25 family glycosyltransferase involved in LPS biosynthesis
MHYTPNISRKNLLNKIFERENIDGIEWIVEYDKEDITYEIYRDNFRADVIEYQQRMPSYYSPGLYPLKPEEVSLALKHKNALERAFKSNSDIFLFLEDDAIVEIEFIKKLSNFIDSIPKDWDAAFIGQAVDKRIPESEIVEGKYWYKKDFPADRCTDSILFTKKAVSRLYNAMESRKICFPIDHEYSYWFRQLNMNVYWLEPPLVTQGSQCGIFDSFQDSHSRYLNPNMSIRADIQELLSGI